MQTDIFNRPSFAIYRDYSATKPSETISYSKLKAMMAQPFTLTDDSLNYENVADATPKIKAIKAQLQLCTPFISDGKTKAIAEISQFNSLVIDIDDTDKPIDDYLFKLEDDLGYSGAYSYFSTCSNGVGGLHGYKIVIPFETPLNMEDYARLANGAAMLFGGDKAQARLQQGFFAPNMVTEAHYETGGKDGTGKGLTAQDRLWQEAMGSYERHIQETLKAVQQTTAKPRPTSLHGNDNIINLINQSYAIDDLLLAKGHKLIAGKWLSPDSTSGAAGGIIFDNGKRFYSHHSTCKLGAVNNGNHSLDAADILSIYEYGGDFNRMIKQQAERLDPQGQKARQIAYAEAQEAIQAPPQPPQPHEWIEPNPINAELLPVKPLDRAMLPTDLADYVFDTAYRADNMNPDFVAVSLVVSLGSLIGARVSLKPKRLNDWEIVPNLWGGLCAPPSSKKSPALSAALKPLDNLIFKEKARMEKEAKAAQEQQKTDNLIKTAKVYQLKKDMKRKGITDAEREEIAAEIIELEEEAANSHIMAEKRYRTDDATPEALADLEKNNPNGILVTRDELVGLLSSLDKEGKDTGRAFYLDGWNGKNSYQLDRIMRGAGYIENHCLSLLGGIQPDRLLSYLDESIKGHGNDGLLQRFQLLTYPDMPQWQYVDEAPNTTARDVVYGLFEKIDKLNAYDLVRMGAKPADQFTKRPYFQFTHEAQERFKEWTTQLHTQTIANEHQAIIAEHLSKYPDLFGSLCLIFHIIDCVQDGITGGVDLRSVEMAINWCNYLETHARRIYGLVVNSAEHRAATLLHKLKNSTKLNEWVHNGFTARQVQQRSWKHLTELGDIYTALDYLIDENWIKKQDIEPTVKGGRPTARYYIHPKVFQT